jgi:hypothetical protein
MTERKEAAPHPLVFDYSSGDTARLPPVSDLDPTPHLQICEAHRLRMSRGAARAAIKSSAFQIIERDKTPRLAVSPDVPRRRRLRFPILLRQRRSGSTARIPFGSLLRQSTLSMGKCSTDRGPYRSTGANELRASMLGI